MTPTADRNTTAAHEVSGDTDGRDLLKLAARSGYASRGLVYLVIGGLALAAAFSATRPAGAEDSIAALFGHSVGFVLVYVLVAGLFCYACWRFWQSLVDTDRHGSDAKGLVIRAGLLASGVTYVLLALFALRLVLGSGGNDGGSGGGQSFLPDWLAVQPWMFWVAALIPFGVGAAHVWKAVKAKFTRHFLCDARTMRWLRPLARAGLIARGIVFFLIALLLVRGGQDYSPESPPSTEDALRYAEDLTLGGVTVGPWILGLLGVGLLAFAIYSFAAAAYRRVRLN